MKYYLLILLVSLVHNQIAYEALIKENVSEEYCNFVINNITTLLNDGYVYNDFLKVPKESQNNSNLDYFPHVDLIEELNKIKKKNRTFFDFYRDLESVLGKSKDGHLNIYADNSPRFFQLNAFYYCIPFKYMEKVNGASYSFFLQYTDTCKDGYSNKTINKIKSYYNKRIISINNMNPIKYLDTIGKNVTFLKSLQARYAFMMKYINQIPVTIFPFKKEELKVSIQFDGVDEILEIDYQFKHKNFINGDFIMSEQKNNLKSILPSFNLEKIELNKKKTTLKDSKSIWNLKSNDEYIKCKIDEANLLNVLYIKSFNPEIENFDNYENIMFECLSKFYSNNYKIVIISDQNNGGYTEICFPFAQYIHPKVSKPSFISMKSTDLISKYFFSNDKNLNPDTCLPYTEKDNILEGEEDKYSDQIYHQKTKYTQFINIFQQKLMERKRKEYLDTQKLKKPTEIIVFTDGFSFSCGSIFIKELQMHGSAIIAGYNIRPDLDAIDFDASQSDSLASSFNISENERKLEKLGFNVKLTIGEHFDPNDKDKPKTPMEYKVYPVDLLSKIVIPYSDDLYDDFIKESKIIFESYNDLDNGKCNKNNKYLYYESEECDKILNIEHGHGGYLCGTDEKWNKSDCIVAYCDFGYILNDERTQCVKDPCDAITLKEISIKEEKEQEYDIEPNNIYIFTIENKNQSFSFYSDIDKLVFSYNKEHTLKPVNNGTSFQNKNKIYVNYYLNNTNTIKIKVNITEKKEEVDPSPEPDPDKNKKPDENGNNSFMILIYLLIIIGAIIIILLLAIIIILIRRKKRLPSNELIEENTIKMQSI